MKLFGEFAGVAIVSLLLVWQSAYAGASFKLEHSFQIPPVQGRIQEIRFVDVDRKGSSDLLIRDSLSVTLFSLGRDSIITTVPLDTMTFWKLAFADVNRDSIPDLVMGYLSTRPNHFPTTIAILRLYDGATGYQWTSSDSFLTSVSGPQGPLGVAAGLLDAADLDGDGYNELIASIDSTADNMDMEGDLTWTESAHSVGYHSFPAVRAWRNGSFFTRLDTLRLSDGHLLGLPTRYWFFDLHCFSPCPSNFEAFNAPVHLRSDGSIGASLGQNDQSYCNSNRISNQNLFSVLALGPILGDSAHPNILVTYHKFFDGFPVCAPIETDSLILFRVETPDSISRVWEIEQTRPLLGAQFLFHPGYPGRFLLSGNGKFLFADASTIAIVDSTGPIPTGAGRWMYPLTDGLPRYVVVTGGALSEYILSDSTATDVSDRPGIPANFSLSPNYPNPFNASTIIEYSIARGSQVSLTVYNSLGQKVADLVGRHQVAGHYRILWDGTDSRGKSVASGVYFYRLEAGEFVQSRKMLVLK